MVRARSARNGSRLRHHAVTTVPEVVIERERAGQPEPVDQGEAGAVGEAEPLVCEPPEALQGLVEEAGVREQDLVAPAVEETTSDGDGSFGSGAGARPGHHLAQDELRQDEPRLRGRLEEGDGVGVVPVVPEEQRQERAGVPRPASPLVSFGHP
jgi:hypothetical protein